MQDRCYILGGSLELCHVTPANPTLGNLLIFLGNVTIFHFVLTRQYGFALRTVRTKNEFPKSILVQSSQRSIVAHLNGENIAVDLVNNPLRVFS